MPVRFLDLLVPDVAGFAWMSLALVAAGIVLVAAVVFLDRRHGGHVAGVFLSRPLTFGLVLLGVTSSVAFATDVALSWLCAVGFVAFSVVCVVDRLAVLLADRGGFVTVCCSVARSLCEVVSWVCVVDLAVLFGLCVVETVVPRYVMLASGVVL